MELSRFRQNLKTELVRMLVRCRLDRLFRYLNRNKLLVVMYHGVTSMPYSPPVWTQLPVDVFKRQLLFLRENYRVVTLAEVVSALAGEGTLPDRAALITFDDGIKNNYSVAFPILKELSLPASIFLTVDMVGTRELLWFDELYLLIQEGGGNGTPLVLPGAGATEQYLRGDWWGGYVICVESLKRVGAQARNALLQGLRERVTVDKERWLEDFGLLDWEDVVVMERSGLVSFGVHTATHRILSELTDGEFSAEVLTPRETLMQRTGKEVSSFCFPNGRPGLDFEAKHQEFLRDCGYRCAFTTENGLFDWRSGEPMRIGRVAAGSDGASDPSYFSLNTSGAVSFIKRLVGARRVQDSCVVHGSATLKPS